MKRRQFFNNLLGIGAGLAIAPRVAADILKTEDKMEGISLTDKGPFTIKDFDEAMMSHKDRFIFSGKEILWNDKGEIICEMDGGSVPRIADLVLIQLLWNNNKVNIAAVVTAVVGIETNSNLPITIHLAAQDNDAIYIMDELVKNYFVGTVRADYVNPEYRSLHAAFAYRGVRKKWRDVYTEEAWRWGADENLK